MDLKINYVESVLSKESTYWSLKETLYLKMIFAATRGFYFVFPDLSLIFSLSAFWSILVVNIKFSYDNVGCFHEKTKEAFSSILVLKIVNCDY